jgi:uncharacterized protein YdaU (DUF1376 family)
MTLNQKEQLAGVISFPFHIAGWLKNTMHLDTLEKGAYFMLLIAHYQAGSIGLPNDDKKLSRICGLGIKTWLRIKPTMQEFFTTENDFWQSKKIIYVLREIHVKSSKQRDKALKRFNSSDATALPRDSQPKTNNQKPYKRKNNKKENIDFVDEKFKSIFECWLNYKKDRNENYKSDTSLKMCYEKLLKLSNDNPNTAKEIVENSIANNYAGLFEIKKFNQSKTNNNGLSKSYGSDIPL